MIKKILFIVILFSAFLSSIMGQELNLNVSVTTPKLNLVDPKVFEILEQTTKEFMNNTKWTDDDFESEERIEGNLQITIKEELNQQTFIADIRINSLRPVYDSNYSTQLINFIDKDITFSYIEQQSIEDSRNAFVDNLSSILTYYAYVILGFDYDSFSALGGEQYFQIGQDIINGIPTAVSNGDRNWTAQGSKRGRYWIVENFTNPRIRGLRKAMYDYHRLSLDKMSEDPDKARSILLGAITDVGNAERAYPNAMVVQMFTDSKREEIIEIFKEANRGQQNKVLKIMSQIDPARSSDYAIFR